jgi:hypothetical protein
VTDCGVIDPSLREAADARARNSALAARLIASLPKRPSIAMLSAQSWPLLCWLAPRIARPQVWRILDADAAAIDGAFERIALWAEERGLTVTWPRRAMLVHLPGGAWRIEGVIGDPAEPARLDLRQADAVAGEALLPGFSAAWISAFADAWHGPSLFTLNQTGPSVLLPLARSTPLPRATDDRAGAVMVTRLAARLRRPGNTVSTAISDWRIRGDELTLQRAWIDAAVASARARLPRAAARITAWAACRGRQARQGRLRIIVPCRDLLVLRGA